MAEKIRIRWRLWAGLGAAALVITALLCHYLFAPWGFYWPVPEKEAELRMQVVEEAEQYLGYNEADGSHRRIIDAYNAYEPLAENYQVQYEDSWCATFVSFVSIQCGLTDIIPTECSCQRQIALFEKLGAWEERDSIVPLPGDVIYYDWDCKTLGDCTGWADHVGIVVGTKWPFIKVIEGNRDDQVCYRYIFMNGIHIRGFGKPDYAAIAENIP